MTAVSTNLYEDFLRASPTARMRLLNKLSPEERAQFDLVLEEELAHPWYRYANDPVAFVRDGLGETIWSRQAQILESVRDNKRTAVPACHAPGKSHIAARAVAWWIACHAPGTAIAITAAPTHRQVRNILWPHIRRVAIRHHLPGEVLTVAWKLNDDIVSYGFSPAAWDETAVQGVHAPNLLIVVDEAGGIGTVIGQALESLMTGGNTRLLLLGNPPTDLEGSWFEKSCGSANYNVIPIGAFDTPNFTGEDAGICNACPPSVPQHPVATHLVDREWVDDVISEFGEESPFVQARVFARFPRQVSNKVIPFDWAESAAQNETPTESMRIRLGVDVAADGGDEFAIAWADGFKVSVRHNSSGAQNANPVDVAGKVLEHILEAEKVHADRGIDQPVRVKIDAIGVGWGVSGLLQRWKDEKRHKAEIIAVNVAERSAFPDKFHNQRAEMWWNGRTLVQPKPDGTQEMRLDIDRRAIVQLSTPMYKSDSSGRILIEKKSDMKRRGQTSPDRAEAVLLAVFEPPGHAAPIAVPAIQFVQSNGWNINI
jgi:hypothetical protein